jgi:hypothetical protein
MCRLRNTPGQRNVDSFEQLAQMGFDAHIRQHAAEDNLADAPLAEL